MENWSSRPGWNDGPWETTGRCSTTGQCGATGDPGSAKTTEEAAGRLATITRGLRVARGARRVGPRAGVRTMDRLGIGGRAVRETGREVADLPVVRRGVRVRR